MVGLTLLLPIPLLALYCLTPLTGPWIPIGYSLGISVVTLLLYRSDKRRAEAGAWRIPENTLHLAELAGGWPAAFAAQRLFRHKISKRSYQFVFWCIVLMHQIIAFDYLQGWSMTKAILRMNP